MVINLEADPRKVSQATNVSPALLRVTVLGFSLLLPIAHMLMVSQSAPAPHAPGLCLQIDEAVPLGNMLQSRPSSRIWEWTVW